MLVALSSVSATALPLATRDASCGPRTPAAAAKTLVHEDATVSDVATVAGLPVAVATDGRIAPGFATALLQVGDRWCSVDHFNAAAAQHLAGADAATIAAAFASVAGMQYLGDVAVRDVFLAGPVVFLRTAGRRPGAGGGRAVPGRADGGGARAVGRR